MWMSWIEEDLEQMKRQTNKNITIWQEKTDVEEKNLRVKEQNKQQQTEYTRG